MTNGGALSEASADGRTMAVHRDAQPKDEPLAMDFVTDETFTPQRAGTYTVIAVTRQPRVRAAWIAMPPQPQPISSR